MKKFIVRLTIFIFVFICVNGLSGILLKKHYLNFQEKHKSPWGKYRWQEFYETPKNTLDLLFLGNSSIMKGINPEVFDSTLNVKSFNMASAGQGVMSGYYILEEALRYHKLSTVVFHLWYISFKDNSQIQDYRVNFPHIKSSEISRKFFLNSMPDLEMLSIFFPTYIYRMGLFAHFREAKGNNIRGYHIPSKGYLPNFDTLKANQINPHVKGNPFHLNNLERKPLRFLKKVVDLCEKNNVQLIFLTMPMVPQKLARTSNYVEVSKYFENFANRNKVPYIDYNINNDGVGLVDTLHFSDISHLNLQGSKLFSQHFAKVLAKQTPILSHP